MTKPSSSSRRAVLVFVGYYLPGFRAGGPIRTIVNLIECLGDEFDFYVVTRDRDLGDSKAYQSVVPNQWIKVDNAYVYYLTPSHGLPFEIFKLIRNTPHDVLYLNSFFDWRLTWLAYLSHKLLNLSSSVILAPRGEFSEGAYGLKRWRKVLFVSIVRRLLSDVVWHASTSLERSDIFRVLGSRTDVHVAPNVVVARDLTGNASQEFNHAIPVEAQRQPGVLRVCFLSRIVPIKNPDYCLKILAQVSCNVEFNIYGPIEDIDLWRRCEDLIARLPLNIRVSYNGAVDSCFVAHVIGSHDILFVPSRGENFGHVFLEALSVGVPILVSTNTPWRDLRSKQLGWDLSLDRPEDFVSALEEAAGYDCHQWLSFRRTCVEYARRMASDVESLEMNRAIFR